MTHQRQDARLDARRTALHDSYIWQVNAAVAAGRDRLAWDLADEFPDQALELLRRGDEQVAEVEV